MKTKILGLLMLIFTCGAHAENPPHEFVTWWGGPCLMVHDDTIRVDNNISYNAAEQAYLHPGEYIFDEQRHESISWYKESIYDVYAVYQDGRVSCKLLHFYTDTPEWLSVAGILAAGLGPMALAGLIIWLALRQQNKKKNQKEQK